MKNKEKSSRKTAKSTLQVMAAQISSVLFGYVVIIILARGLGPDEYGVYGVVMSVLIWVEFSTRLGIPQSMTILIPGNDKEAYKYEQSAIGLSLAISILSFLGMVLAAPALANLFNMPEKANLFRLAAIDIPFYSMYHLFMHILSGRRNFAVASSRTIFYAAIKAAGIALLLLFGLSVEGALIVNICASVAGLLLLLTHVSLRKMKPIAGYIRPILKLALPMGLYTLGWHAISSLDLWSLKIFGTQLPDEIIGIYVAAVNVAKVPGIMSFVMTAILIPTLSFAMAKNDHALAKDYVQKSLRFLFVILTPGCVLIAVTSEEIMALLYTETYRSGGFYLFLLVFVFGFLLTFLTTFCAILSGRGEVYLSAAMTLVPIPIGLLLNYFFIPQYGAIGAAFAQFVTIGLVVIFTGSLIMKRFGSLILFATLWKTILATSLMAIGSAYIHWIGLWMIPKYIFLLAVYVLILILLREIKKEDLHPFALWQDN